jgi:hypothetical protein
MKEKSKKKTKKSKIIYEETIYPSTFIHMTGAVWVFAPWIILWDMQTVNMPVIMCAWQNANEPIVAMCHQSLH